MNVISTSWKWIQTVSDFGTPLHVACFNGNLSLVDALLKGGAEFRVKGPANQTPLFIAALRGHFKVVKLLSAKGSALDDQDTLGLTALHAAIIENHEDVAVGLIRAGCGVKKRDSKGNLPIHYAVKNSQIGIIKLLEKAGCSIDSRNSNFETPLTLAVLSGNIDCISIILKLGCDVNVSRPDRSTALHTLVSCCHGNQKFHKILKLLLLADADIDAQAFNTLETPLYRAISLGKPDFAELLLAYGADMNLSSPFDITALHLAYIKQYYHIASMMLHCGLIWKRERWIKQISTSNCDQSKHFHDNVIAVRNKPQNLVNLCRTSFRKKTRGQLFRILSAMHMTPKPVKSYLCLSDMWLTSSLCDLDPKDSRLSSDLDEFLADPVSVKIVPRPDLDYEY
ncbi:ANK2-like protein [Mya arenaria]|uniref:ANK2-like protein n=1 Tax=Mya arenaria TaxID=6604 RepID=A0ABY7G3M2_MYAAR|nr:ANK2-like protein [Mya arenaria]